MDGTNTVGREAEPLTLGKIQAAMDEMKKLIAATEYQGKLPQSFEVAGIVFHVSPYLPEGTAIISTKAARILLKGLMNEKHSDIRSGSQDGDQPEGGGKHED